MPLEIATELKNLMSEPSIVNALSDISNEYRKRQSYTPPICSIFDKKNITIKALEEYKFKVDINSKKQLGKIIDANVQLLIEMENTPIGKKYNLMQKQKIGVVFSGGPSPGGHNVIAGLFDALKKSNHKSSLLGFIMGPKGILEKNYIELTSDLIDKYRNLGGFNMIKTGRTKIDTIQKMNLFKKTCKKLNINAIIIIGGDDSNTNTAFLAQEMFNEKIKVIGVPKTIDGDIQVKDIKNKNLCATSFGFDTAAKSFAHFISNLCTDAESDVKYWHICKIMGRSASHLALEVALQVHPNLTLIGEELPDYINLHKLEKAKIDGTTDYTAYGMTLNGLVKSICRAIIKRAEIGKNFGVIVIPEGILEFINEIQVFIIKISSIIGNYNSASGNSFHDTFDTLEKKRRYLQNLTSAKKNVSLYSIWNTEDNDLFNSIPTQLQRGLLTERDSHGNFQFSQIQTEEILLKLIKKELKMSQEHNKYVAGINRKYYEKIMERNGLNKHTYGCILFRNWNKNNYLLFNKKITTKKKLVQTLVENNLLNSNNRIPESIEKLFEKSVPNFKAQTHSYGYDGRGNNPTHFDCTYAYNLGQTAFHLINNNVTGQMAGILNLEDIFHNWKPISIPIAPLMHLEERNGKPSLVFKKSMVDVKSPAFQIFKILSEKWLLPTQDKDHYRISTPIQLTKANKDTRPITLLINSTMEKMLKT